MGLADLGETDDTALIDHEGRGIGGFAAGIPAEIVEIGDLLAGICHEGEAVGPIATTSADEFFGVISKVLSWPGIDHQELGVEGFELFGLRNERADLAGAHGTLVTRQPRNMIMTTFPPWFSAARPTSFPETSLAEKSGTLSPTAGILSAADADMAKEATTTARYGRNDFMLIL